MNTRFKEGQYVMVRCAPGLFRDGVVKQYIGEVGDYENYRVVYKNEDGNEYEGDFLDVNMNHC